MPWGKDAFERARREGKPVLLDIGAVWCHWCHVIDRESYEDPALAELINERFVPVKVDRDERPDVDSRYQLAVQALTGQGGWPLTAFLTPDGHVFFGGTYFPPQDLYGRPGFRTVLEKVSDRWSREGEHAKAHALALHQELERSVAARRPGELDARLVDEALEGFLRLFDGVNGGFGGAPKFPHPAALELCLARYARTREPHLRTLLEGTLDGMALGGIHDQLGGGFHRYSVDAEWVVPHFEKMLYDNAGLLRNYARGWQLLRDPRHRAAAEGIVRWALQRMADPRGGFCGSQDADVGLDDDGDYWTWTLAELRDAVRDPDLERMLREHFDVGERGEMHHHPAKNVLFVAKSAERLANELGLPAPMVEERLAHGKAQMLQARERRTMPAVDTTLYASWNGMMAGAMLHASRALGDAACRDAALKALDRVLREAYRPGEGIAHVLGDGGARVRGLLEDQVFVADALLDAYEATGEARWLRAAEELLRWTLDHFQDPQDGLLTDTARDVHDTQGVAALAARRKPVEDAPTPAANSVAASALDRLAAIAGDEGFRAAADRILRGMAGSAARMGLFAGSFFLALEQHLQPHTQVVIVGRGPEARALHEAALQSFAPNLVVLPAAEGGFVPAPAREAAGSWLGEEHAVAVVCRGQACSPPARSPEELRRLLEPSTSPSRRAAPHP
jgi:hypothetical protein